MSRGPVRPLLDAIRVPLDPRVAATDPGNRPGRLGHTSIARGGVGIGVALTIAAATSFAFWLAAAHTDTPSQVGDGAALFSSVLFVNYATSLGLPVALARHARGRTTAANSLFRASIVATVAGSTAGTVIFVALAPASVTATLDAEGRVAGALLFLVLSAGGSAAVLVEIRLMALRRWKTVVARVALVGLVRFPLLAMSPISNRGLWLFVVAAGPPAASALLAVPLWFVRPREAAPTPRSDFARCARVNYLSMLAVQAPQFGLPFVVLLHVTARENAVFYLSWGATSFMFLVPQMLGQILLIEHSDHPAVLRAQVRFCMTIAAGATACALLLSVAGASLVAVLYGSAYREVAVVLPLMIAGSFGWALTAPLLARARLLGDAVASIGIAVAFGGFVLGGAQLLVPLHGVAGASAAWVVGNAGALAVAWALTARAPARDQIVVPDLARQPVALRVGAEEEA